MAKPDEDSAPAERLPAPAGVSKPGSTGLFRDTAYTSRVLVLPDGRQLAVARSRVSVPPDDIVALEYLGKHPDLKPLQE